MNLKMGTRGSKLALTQTNFVAEKSSSNEYSKELRIVSLF